MIKHKRLEPRGAPPGENDFLPLGVDHYQIETPDDWQEVVTEHAELFKATFGSLMNAYRRLVTNGAVRAGGNGKPEVSIYLVPECDQTKDADDED